MVPNFLIILSGFSFGFVKTGVLVFNGKSNISPAFTAGVSHGGGLTLHETYVKSVAELKASMID